MSKDQAVSFLEYFCTQLELDILTFDNTNNVQMHIDDMGIVLHYSEELDVLVFNILICPIQDKNPDSKSDMLYTIMTGNYLWGQTAGGTLGIDSRTDYLCLSRIYELSENDGQNEYSALLDSFASLVGAAKYWKAFVEGVAESGTTISNDHLMYSNTMLNTLNMV